MDEALSDEVSLAQLAEQDIAVPGRELAEELHAKEYAGLIRFLLLQGATWTEAQDAAQEAFTSMCRPGTRITRARAWLRTVAWRSWIKQQVRWEDTCAEMHEACLSLKWDTPAHAVELGEEARRVVQLLSGLPPKQRAAMAWHMDGFTTEESARAMRTSPAAVRQNLARARAALKAGLGLGDVSSADDAWEGEVS